MTRISSDASSRFSDELVRAIYQMLRNAEISAQQSYEAFLSGALAWPNKKQKRSLLETQIRSRFAAGHWGKVSP